MGLASGLAAQLGFKEETTWGTAVTVDRFTPFVDESVEQKIDFLDSASIIAGARVLRSQMWSQGVHRVNGDVGFEVYDRSIGLFLKHALGSVTTSGTTAPYTHLFTPGDLLNKGLTVQIGRPDRQGTVQPFTYAGCKVASWEIAGAAAQIATMGLSLVAKSETTSTGLVTGAAAAIGTSIGPMTFVGGSFSLAGSSLCVHNFKISGDNKLAADRLCIGQTTIDEPLEAGLREYKGEVTLEFPDLYHYNRFVNGTEGTLSVGLSRGTSTLTIVSNVRTEGSTPNVSGQGMLTQKLNFTCVASTSSDASALSVTFVTSDSQP